MPRFTGQWSATVFHNCSAYIVDDMAQRSSDDGEPSGTAGIPMLEVLRKNGLRETAAVVGIGHDEHFVIPQLGNIELVADAAAQCQHDRHQLDVYKRQLSG